MAFVEYPELRGDLLWPCGGGLMFLERRVGFNNEGGEMKGFIKM